jgi:hypothetical protein
MSWVDFVFKSVRFIRRVSMYVIREKYGVQMKARWRYQQKAAFRELQVYCMGTGVCTELKGSTAR